MNIIIEPDGDGYHAYIPALPGLHECGDTEEAARDNAKEAALAYLESMLKHGELDAKTRGRLMLGLSYAEPTGWEPVGVCGECGQSLNARWRLQVVAQHLRRVLADAEAEALAHSEGEVTL